ncbi:phosphatase PAP2 family protein [Bacillus thuringiensis]|uniref:phosphatase PAP2 family protein n=1 Tax=Bacillus thuringiensis TaxID=1428 RepID=UPI0021D672B3|nr:phosphatase PAP2 family protein [Bacillus thuringiensis]MCU7667612.1 phosphatase PAP2 family protein [Bacillus thuringiensis]
MITKNLKIQHKSTFIVSLISLICFGIMAVLVTKQKTVAFDNKVIAFIQGLESPVLTTIMKVFTTIGSTKTVTVICLIVMFVLYKVLKQRSECLLFIAAILGSNVLFISLKMIFQRERPSLYRLIEETGYSFPSGHSTIAFTLYGTILFLLWRYIQVRWKRVVLMVLTAMMILVTGISRIYLGVHYPSDILAGFLIAGFWITLIIGIHQKNTSEKNILLEIKKKVS